MKFHALSSITSAIRCNLFSKTHFVRKTSYIPLIFHSHLLNFYELLSFLQSFSSFSFSEFTIVLMNVHAQQHQLHSWRRHRSIERNIPFFQNRANGTATVMFGVTRQNAVQQSRQAGKPFATDWRTNLPRAKYYAYIYAPEVNPVMRSYRSMGRVGY